MTRLIGRAGWVVAGVLAIAVIALAAGAVRGGPLDPPGEPAPTGKTLEEIPGSWSRALAADDGDPVSGCNSTRFACVLGDLAVLDRESGLVWQRGPTALTETWHLASRTCYGIYPGNRMGWRLPSLEELRSLLTSTGLPAGHPFGAAGEGTFWTGTTVSDSTTQAYVVNTANATATFTAVKDTNSRRAWCVRGANGYDAQ